MQFSKMQNENYSHWFRYSTTPNVPTLSSQSSQAKHLALIFLLQPLPSHWLYPNSDHRQVFGASHYGIQTIKMGFNHR